MYTAFDATKPDAADTGPEFATITRENLLAIRDSVVAGTMAGWDLTSSGGSEPATLTYANGSERVRLSITWTNGSVTQTVYEYSPDSGSTWESMGTESINYDIDSNVTGINWS